MLSNLVTSLMLAAVTDPTISTIGPGILQVTIPLGGNWAAWAQMASGNAGNFPAWGVLCSPVTFPSGVCRIFTCSTANACVVSGNTPDGLQTRGTGSTLTVTFTRQFIPFYDGEVGITVGANEAFYKNDQADIQVSASTLQGLSWGRVNYNVAIFTGPATFNFSLSMPSPDVVAITLTTVTGRSQGVGWSLSTANPFPDWFLLCTAQTGPCIVIRCVRFLMCFDPGSLRNGTEVSRSTSTGEVIYEISTTDNSALAIASGYQPTMMWTDFVTSTHTVFLYTTQSWAFFASPPLLSPFVSTSPAFLFSMSQGDFQSVTMTLTTNPGTFAAVGWLLNGRNTPEFLLACDGSKSNSCVYFQCVSKSCTSVVYADVNSVINPSTRTVTFTRPLSPRHSNPHVITNVGGAQNMCWAEAPAVSAISASDVNSLVLKNFQASISPFPGVVPSFTIQGSRVSSTIVSVSFVVNQRQYVATGLSNGVANFAPLVAVCEPISLAVCTFFLCESATTCAEYTGDIVQQVVVKTTRTVILLGPQPPFKAGDVPYMYWYAASIPPGGLSVSPALVQNQNYDKSLVKLTQIRHIPSFGIAVASESSTTISLTISTNPNKYVVVGFNDGIDDWPLGAAVCEPATLSKCSLYVCTSNKVCVPYVEQNVGQTTDRILRKVVLTIPRAGIPAQGAFIYWKEESIPAIGLIVSSELVQSVLWFTTPLVVRPRQAQPSFDVGVGLLDPTTAEVIFAVPRGSYVSSGLNDGVKDFPLLVAICEPASLVSCGLYACSSNSACSIYTGGARAIVTRFPNLYSVNGSQHKSTLATQTSTDSGVVRLQVPRSELPSGDLYYYWDQKTIPTGGLTLSPQLASGVQWSTLQLTVGPDSTTPTFAIAYVRPDAATLTVIIAPKSGYMTLFGWRSLNTTLFPGDVAICPTSGRCLDVVCTSASSCEVRTDTIYKTNVVSESNIRLDRSLNSGSVPLSVTKDMYIAWDTQLSTSGVISPADAQGRSWKYYTVGIPAVSGAYSFAPALLGGIFAMLYLL